MNINETLSGFKANISPGPWKLRKYGEDFFVEAPKAIPTAGYNIQVLGDEDANYITRRADSEFVVFVRNNLEAIISALKRIE